VAITQRRWGAATKVERIMPVEYSLVTTRTARTPMASDDGHETLLVDGQ
jgi:hypothetical protein